MDDRMGDNINGPSLIRVPDWLPNPLGKYYLYFADHGGTYIRLAVADKLEGPWQIHSPGALDIGETGFNGHIASPDVHVIDETREIRMYYHGNRMPGRQYQTTCLAVSGDGLRFTSGTEPIGDSYWRAFRWKGYWYTLEMPGQFRRSIDGISNFEEGPILFTPNMRHSAVLLRDDLLHVFYSNACDCPERILHATICLTPEWFEWKATPPVTLLEPEMEYEGADCPLEASKRGSARERVRQLRDPCIFEEDDRVYFLYSVAGEKGIAIGELTETGECQ
jgi:hypothetical protein